MSIGSIGLIGSGNIATAFIEGWLRADPAMAGRIIVTDAHPQAARKLSEATGVATAASNEELVSKSDLVLLAVKPHDVEEALKGTSEQFRRGKILMSVAAGRTIPFLEALFSFEVAVIRLMPNVAVTVGAGTIAFAAGGNVDQETEEQVCELLAPLGRVVPLPERLFAAATAIGGSGPGFMALIIDAFIDAGVMAGLPVGAARELTYSMLSGTSRLLSETGISPVELRHSVTSPAGTTAAGLAQLERDGARSAIIDAVQAAYERAHKLG